MTSLLDDLTETTGNAFETLGLNRMLGSVRVSDRPDLAQFQCNGAMAAAKQAGKNPREIASDVVSELQKSPFIEKLEIAGPGFININVKADTLYKYAIESLSDNLGIDNIGQGAKVIFDYGGPNVAKAMHVGHLRSAIIGEALKRAYNFAGYDAIGDIHLGDWGTQMGMVISELENRHPDWPYFDDSVTEFPQESPITLGDLEEIYPAASAACKQDEQRLEQARQATVELQNGRPGYRALWKHMVEVSIEAIKANYAKLNVHFELWNGEASVHDLIAPMVQDLKEKKLAVTSDGALVMHVSKDSDSKEIPPLILYKKDGAVMYGTTDLATLLEREKYFQPEKVTYVVDKRQNLHFEQVFRAAKASKITPEKTDLTFIGYGTMNGTDGKPFKTREGGVMKLEDLIKTSHEKALQKMSEANITGKFDEAQTNDIAHKVSIAAIKFADLQNHPNSDYVFDLDRMTSFEGKTGPYLLYQAVRINSLLEKADQQDIAVQQYSLPEHLASQEIDLLLQLTQFPENTLGVIKNNSPHVLSDYLYKLAQNFSSFYSNCHIMSEKKNVTRQFRLKLCQITRTQMITGLNILGIDVPEKM